MTIGMAMGMTMAMNYLRYYVTLTRTLTLTLLKILRSAAIPASVSMTHAQEVPLDFDLGVWGVVPI